MQCCELNDGENSGQTNVTIYEVKKDLGEENGEKKKQNKNKTRDEYAV